MSSSTEMRDTRRRTVAFALILAFALIGVALLTQFLGLGETASIAVFFTSVLLVLPLMRSVERLEEQSGCSTSAGRRYGRRMIVASTFYVLTLFGAIWLSKHGSYSTPVYVGLALAPSQPVIAMIWAMARLLIEENDEYLRSRFIHHGLIATGFILAISTVWGFLEQFNVVTHVATYWVFPAWVMCLGLSQCWAAVKP